MSDSPLTITASGGVVVRHGTEGPEYLVVHRPRYDDWSLPKGKDEPGESDEETAVREILEETGVHCQIFCDLGTTDYPVKKGHKTVHWFGTRPVVGGHAFLPNSEVDEIRWLSADEAGRLLTYDHDRNVLDRSKPHLTDHGTLYLVRHGRAGDRNEWEGDDRMRPLDAQGEVEAEALADLLEHAHVERIVSSPARRCTQTVDPLASRIGLEVETDDGLWEDALIEETAQMLATLDGLNTVACTHGDLIPRVVNDLAEPALDETEWPKGATWAITIDNGRLTHPRRVEPALVAPRMWGEGTPQG